MNPTDSFTVEKLARAKGAELRAEAIRRALAGAVRRDSRTFHRLLPEASWSGALRDAATRVLGGGVRRVQSLRQRFAAR